MRASLDAARNPLLAASAWSGLLQVTSRLSVLLVTYVLASTTGVEGLGAFAATQAMLLLSVALYDAGVSQWLLREVAAGGARRELVVDAITCRLMLLPIWLLVVAGLLHSVSSWERNALLNLLWILDGLLLSGGSLVDAYLTSTLQFRRSSLARSFSRVVMIAITSLCFLVPHGAAPVVAVLATVVADAFFLLSARSGPLVRRPRAHIGSRGRDSLHLMRAARRASLVTRRALPYALTGLLIMGYNRLDIALVQLLAGRAEAGLYAPASRLQDALLFVPSTVVAGLLPVLASQDPAQRLVTLYKSAKFGAIAACLASGGTIACVLLGLLQLLGPGFVGSELPVILAVLSLPFIAVSMCLMAGGVAAGLIRQQNLVLATTFVSATLAHVLLDSSFGAVAAGGIALGREVLVTCLSLALILPRLRRHVRQAPAA